MQKIATTTVKFNPNKFVSRERAEKLANEQSGFIGFASTETSQKLSPAEMVSQARAAQLNRQAGQSSPMERTAASNFSVPKKRIIKEADTGASWRGSGGTVQQTPPIYGPLWLDSNLNFPRDRGTINAWCRSFFTLNPIIRNAILLHSTYPISKLNIKCKNLKVKKFFEDMMEELDLEEICTKIAQEFWVIGEAFPYAELPDGAKKWSRVWLLNPDYVNVDKAIGGGDSLLSLRPDPNLIRVVNSNKPSDQLQRQKLSPEIIEHVKRGHNIPLNSYNVSHISNSNFDYEIRGQSLIVSCFRDLMLYDKYRESKFVQADDFTNPITLWKIGGATGEYKPNPADLEAWRETIEQATYDKNFKIITHDSVTCEPINRGGGILDTSNDIDRLIKNFYIGLMVPSVLMDGGSDTSYANGSVALDVLKGRYLQFRWKIAKWLRRKIFAPISKINEFCEFREDADGTTKKFLTVPEIEWNYMSMFDMGDHINTLVQLRAPGEGGKPGVSEQALYRSLGLDWEEEQQKLREEAIQSAIFTKELAALSKKSLSELRSLKGKNSIIEEDLDNKEPPLPGEETDIELPGMPPMGAGMELPTPAPTQTPTTTSAPSTT